ncbi:MAG: trimethylamine methyltransferase [Clostridiaceae bacterium BRH_c20a]|nr:MAG: trimethylamine methyltransferase [Clostridiaceae bacterium BRH_c20a]
MPVPCWRVLAEKDIELIHETTLAILKNTGIEVRYEPALETFKKAGARVEGQRVFLSSKLMETELKNAPKQFTLHARNPAKNVKIGGAHTVLVPGYGAPFVTDQEKGKRKATFHDYENFSKLAGASPNLSMTGGVLVEPNDLPNEIRAAKMIYACIKNSDKCFMGSASGAQKAHESIGMVQILFGPEHSIIEKPALISLINTITPLILDERMLGALMEYAKSGQAVIVASLGMAGATSPSSLAGTLAMQNAEILTGIVLVQLVRPGAPVVYGAASSITEMRYGSLAIGAPETSLITSGSAQLAAYYGLPSRGGGAITDSKIPDAQSGWESMMNLLTTVKSGINFVLHAAGILEYYMTMSYEKFIMDDELCGMVLRIKNGIEVNEASLALPVIEKVGPGGHFLDQDHTLHTYKREFWRPGISHRGTYDHWKMKGSPTALEESGKKYRQILDEYQPPQLDVSIDRSLQAFIKAIEN